MTYEFIYWFILFVIVLFGGFGGYFAPWEGRRFIIPGCVLFLILFVVIGLKLFGWPIKDEAQSQPQHSKPASY